MFFTLIVVLGFFNTIWIDVIFLFLILHPCWSQKNAFDRWDFRVTRMHHGRCFVTIPRVSGQIFGLLHIFCLSWLKQNITKPWPISWMPSFFPLYTETGEWITRFDPTRPLSGQAGEFYRDSKEDGEVVVKTGRVIRVFFGKTGEHFPNNWLKWHVKKNWRLLTC